MTLPIFKYHPSDWQTFFDALERDGSPTAYVFQCLLCGKYGAYQDCD